MNKKELRKFLVKDKNINGLTFDKYAERVESMTRAVIEERPTNFREIDVFSRLIMDRIIFLGMGIEENISNIITAQLLFLESVDSKKDVLLYINSPGGSVYAGLGIYDTMQYISPDVATTILTALADAILSSSYKLPKTCMAISLKARVGPWYNSTKLTSPTFLIFTTSSVIKL